MNDQIRKLFEDRYRLAFHVFDGAFERTSRGTYNIDEIQNLWEGFYACYEILKKENTELKAEIERLQKLREGK